VLGHVTRLQEAGRTCSTRGSAEDGWDFPRPLRIDGWGHDELV